MESEEGGDGVNYSGNFFTDTFFPTFDDDVTWADGVSIKLGFILVKSSYNKTRDGRPYRYLRCDRSRRSKLRDLENAIRKDTKTKANGCPFYIKIYYDDTLDCLPSLECVVAHSVGYDHIDLSECRRRGISVANVGDAFSDDVADCAVGLLIDVLRKVSAAHRFVRAGSWPEQVAFPLGSRVSGLSFLWF
uniref:D-isomer specific 2-hydroxyacid dehydrogenase catalytic domain-containing protein n=1 Tax=Chenopodium quinoa TaxID=63459 RepID=A0A803LQV6_CHEQI